MEVHQEIFGGSISMTPAGERRRALYQWVLCARQAGGFLRVIQPYLIVKVEVAAAAIEFIDLQGLPSGERRDYSQTVERNGRLWSSPTIRPEFQERQLAVWMRIRELNSRGAPWNAKRGRLALEDCYDKRRTTVLAEEISA
jgi:hypothetical protein